MLDVGCSCSATVWTCAPWCITAYQAVMGLCSLRVQQVLTVCTCTCQLFKLASQIYSFSDMQLATIVATASQEQQLQHFCPGTQTSADASSDCDPTQMSVLASKAQCQPHSLAKKYTPLQNTVRLPPTIAAHHSCSSVLLSNLNSLETGLQCTCQNTLLVPTPFLLHCCHGSQHA